MQKKTKTKKIKTKKRASFVSPLTKELQRESLGNILHTLFLENKEKTNQKIHRLKCFPVNLYLAQQKNLVNQSKNKNGPKLDIGWICLKLFNWNTVERNINLESFCMYHKLIIISPWTCTCTYRKTKKINVWLSIGIILIIISYWHNFSFEFLFRH